MKLKVTPKDLGIFAIFCVVLLYFCAIAVLNLTSLVNEGTFMGINPFPAFTPKYILYTLFLFFIILIIVFFSVSSSIFSRDKGFGLKFGEKEQKGFSRWLNTNEMKRAYKVFKVGVRDIDAPAGGIVLVNDGKNIWVDNSENHTLVIGTTGSGKTTAVVDPLIYSLCKSRESMVFTDPKGEIYINHAELLRARGYKIVVLNFRNPQFGNAWNPLTLPYQFYHEGNVDKAIELVDDVASNIVKDKQAQDPFWQNSASDYFSGCTLGLLEDAKEEEVNLNSISLMTTVGEEKFGAGSNYIKEYFNLKGEQSSAYTFASNTINSPTETKGGILSTFRQKIRIFSSREMLSEMLSYSDFNVRDIGKEPTAVFMIIHDEKTTYHALATIFIKQCYETLISVAQECGGKLPVRTNFILDEFANMPALKDVTTMVTAARSRLMRFTFIIQNFSQLNQVYGKEDAETIRSNCGNLIYILTTELSALEEISKLCGEIQKENSDGKKENRPLVTVSDLQKMKLNEVIIIRHRMNPFKTQLVQAFNIDWGDKEFGKAEFKEREKKEIKYFDVKEFVRLRKRSKMGMDDNSSGGAPDFNSLMGGGNMPKIPTFEEFMAARNGEKKNNNDGGFNSPIANMNNMPKIPTFEEFMASRNGENPTIPASSPKKPLMPTFDVDDLVKRIDAKIAELEAQEKEEENKKKAENGNNEFIKSSVVNEKTNLARPKLEVENLNEESISKISNPFENNNKFKTIENTNKDIIQGIDTIETGPINAPIIESAPETPKVPSNEINTFNDLINNNEVINQPVTINNISDQLSNINKEVEVPIETPYEEIPKMVETPINVPTIENVSSVSNNNETISDDAFFDDFFDND